VQLQCSTVFFKSYFCLMGEVRSVRKRGIFVTFPFWFKASVFECDCRKITSIFFVTSTYHLHSYTTVRFLKALCKSELNTWSKLYMYLNIMYVLHTHTHTLHIIHITEHTHTHTDTTPICHKNKHSLGIYKSVVFPIEAGPPFLQQSACVCVCIQWHPFTTSALMWFHSHALIKWYFFNIYIYTHIVFNCVDLKLHK
jgi:hypothetical protein